VLYRSTGTITSSLNPRNTARLQQSCHYFIGCYIRFIGLM